MPKYTVHPWRHPSDLLAVRDQLYPTIPPTGPSPHPTAQQRHASTRILSCWKLRGNLPHAVESTALLVDAQLHHTLSLSPHPKNSNDPATTPSQSAIRATYASAFSRFVTGFCDIGRAREGSLQPSSMLDVAKRIGMPPDFVALRHEATHEEGPSLPRLVAAVERGVAWLWEVYWVKLDAAPTPGARGRSRVGGVDGSGDGGVDVKAEARQLLKAYRATRREALRTRRQDSAEHGGEVARAAQACYELYAPGPSAGPRAAARATDVGALAELLVEERFIFPSSRRLGESMAGAFTIWDPLLHGIAALEGGPRLVSALIQLLHAQLVDSNSSQDSQDTRGEAAALWLLHLVLRDARGWTRELRVGTLRMCCLYPGPWTQFVGAKLLEEDEQLGREWREMFEASLLASDEDGMEVDASAGAEGAGVAGAAAPTRRAADASTTASSTRTSDDVGSVPGWRRAARAPRVPIGVVG
ncbi:rRNA-processing protein las1 [Teratosphaeriaceae sp. CCFEE 6253]|nr:rRNA-processing protein las1 [Teratosphaeriaceae sp. CCFEE 6253]